MRWPSAAMMGLALYFVFLVGSRLWDREAGLLAALALAWMPAVALAASVARPYAFTLMTLSGFAWALLRWIDAGRIRDGIAVALFAALTAYGHIILALGLIVPAVYAAWSRPKWTHLIVLSGVTA